MKTISDFRKELEQILSYRTDIKGKEAESFRAAVLKANKTTHVLCGQIEELIRGFREVAVAEYYGKDDKLCIDFSCYGEQHIIVPKFRSFYSTNWNTYEFWGYEIDETPSLYSEHDMLFKISELLKSAMLK